jgi:putative sigma-54 modulation protein
MKVDIQSIHFKADQKLTEYIERKLEKLHTFYDGILDATVFLKLENNNKRDSKQVEIKLRVQNQSIFKTQTEQSFEAATDIAIEALKVQIKKYKDKLQSVS